jgi:hypothetical protein
MRRSRLVFHPSFVLVCAALAILSYIAWMRWRFPGGNLWNNFFYVLPIIVPFVGFVFDRVRHLRASPLIELVVDCAIVGTALLRAAGDVPVVSGHALFLTYAITRPGSWLTKLTAGLVMLQVIYLKIFVWHDLVTPVAGITLGLLAGGLVRRIPRRTIDRRSNLRCGGLTPLS